MAGGVGVAGGLLAAEVCAPLLLLCWLCCWPQDASSDNSSDGKHPQRPMLTHVHESGSRRRSSDFFSRRIGSSAVSLHLPSTSGYTKPLPAHRSHEEIGRRKSNHDNNEPETRYHSAPSVIDEVLHRRDWERSTKDLYIPLKPDIEVKSNSSESPEAPHAEPESSSIEDIKSDKVVVNKTCKKHYTNIKSSRGRKEKESTDIKDSDATEFEPSNFYIGETEDEVPLTKSNEEKCEDVHKKSIYKAKDAKQSFNESIRNKEKPRHTLGPVDEHHPSLGFSLDDVIEQLDTLDRSGAEHHSIESRLSLSNRPVFPPPSVEPVGYDGGACYLAEVGTVSELRCRAPDTGPPRSRCGVGAMRSRHASDGDILAPPHRPESGAFSESDLDLELEGSEERPPAYEDIQQYTTPDCKETAI